MFFEIKAAIAIPTIVVNVIPIVAPNATVNGFFVLDIIESATSCVLSPNSARSIIVYVAINIVKGINAGSESQL